MSPCSPTRSDRPSSWLAPRGLLSRSWSPHPAPSSAPRRPSTTHETSIETECLARLYLPSIRLVEDERTSPGAHRHLSPSNPLPNYHSSATPTSYPSASAPVPS